MELTWVAIAASLCMACGALLVFVFAVKRDYFRDLEDVKFQVFWSDPLAGGQGAHAEEPGPRSDSVPGEPAAHADEPRPRTAVTDTRSKETLDGRTTQSQTGKANN